MQDNYFQFKTKRCRVRDKYICNNYTLIYPISGGEHGHSHGGGHGHSDGGHGHSHGGPNKQIFKGVYFHILANTTQGVG